MNKVIKDLKTEIALTELEIEENQKIITKYEKKVFKEKEKFKKKYKYESEDELREAFENDAISLKEYDKVLDFFQSKEKSINEMFLEYLKRTEKQNKQTLKYLENELLVEIARS